MVEIPSGVRFTDKPYNYSAQLLYQQIGVIGVYPEHERRGGLAIKPGVSLTDNEQLVYDFLKPDGFIVSRFRIDEEFVGSKYGSGLSLFKNILREGVKPKLVDGTLVGGISGHGYGMGVREMYLTHHQLCLLYILSHRPEDFFSADQLSYGLYGQSEGYADPLRGVTIRLNKALRDLNGLDQPQTSVALEMKFRKNPNRKESEIAGIRLLMEPKGIAA